MITLKIHEGKDGIFKNTDDAIKYMIENNFEDEVSVYDIDSNEAYKKTNEIYKAIKDYNNGKPLDEQILPSNPFGFRGILGCLGVKVYTITLGTYKINHNCITPLGFNDSVLDTSVEKANISPGQKAILSLSTIGKML